jgi:hypothetical protein
MLSLPTAPSLWFFAGSLVMAPMSDVRVVGHFSVCDLLLVVAAVFALGERLFRREPLPIYFVYVVVAAVFTFRFIIGAMGSGPSYWQAYAVVLVAAAITPLAVGIMRVRTLSEFNFLLAAWTVGGLIGVFFIIGFCNGFFSTHEDVFWRYHLRARGLTPHPNLAGLGAFMTLPGLLVLLALSKGLVLRLVAVVLILASLKAIDYTGTRSAFIAASIFIGLWAMLSVISLYRREALTESKMLEWVIFGIVGLAALTVYILAGGSLDLVSGVWKRLVGGEWYAVRSEMARGALSNLAWEGFWRSPVLGEGYQATAFTTAAVAHNMYLQYLHATGLLGFAAFIATLLFPLAYPLQGALRGLTGKAEVINNTLLAAMGAVLIWLFAQSAFADYEAILIFCLPLILRSNQLFRAEPTHQQP